MSWEPPRCIHGRIILGCPEDDCPTQNAYLDQHNAAVRDYEAGLERAARELVWGRRASLEGKP